MEDHDISQGLDDFVKKVKEFKSEELVVPSFYIADWPNRVGHVEVSIRKFGFCYRVHNINGSLFRLVRWFCLGILPFPSFKFIINRSGSLRIGSVDNTYDSRSDQDYGPVDTLERANALLLFNQLKDRALPKVIKKVERDSKYNQEAVEAVKKALEPFLSQIVADELER